MAQQVADASRRGIEWLRSAQGAEGAYRDWPDYPGAVTALAYHTLRVCGVARDDPAAQRVWSALRRVYRRKDLRTYSASIYLMAIAQHGDVATSANGDRDVSLAKDDAAWADEIVRYLVGCQGAGGAWSYGTKPDKGEWDLSNTQFALLGLKSAARCGISVDASVWTKALGHLLRTQQQAGPKVARDPGPEAAMDQARGWNYDGRFDRELTARFDAAMTAGAVSSVVICRSELPSATGTASAPDMQVASERSARDGLAWLGSNWQHLVVDTYRLYAIERAGMLAGVEWMSGIDWYGEGAKALIANQATDGSWEGDPSPVRGLDLATTRVIETCFCLLFLQRGTRPVHVGALTPSSPEAGLDFAAAGKLEGEKLSEFLDLVLTRWRGASDVSTKRRLFDQVTALGAKVVEPLLEMLRATDAERRGATHALLKHATGLDFGFDPASSDAERAAALGRWRDWWASARDRLAYDAATKRLDVRPASDVSAAMSATRDAYRDLTKWREQAGVPRTPQDRAKWWEEYARHADVIVDAFATSDWDSWDPVGDRDVLSFCLTWTAERAKQRGLWSEARRAYELHIAKLPDVSGQVRCCSFPDFLARSGDLAEGIAWLRELSPRVKGYAKALVSLRLGDLRAATAGTAAANADYEAAESAMANWNGEGDEDAAVVGSASAEIARRWISSEITARRSWIGRPTRDLPRASWVGGPQSDWVRLKGRVVVVCVVDKLTESVRSSLTGFERFARSNAGKPVTVGVVVHSSGAADFEPSKQTFRSYLTAIRTRWKLELPFLVVDDGAAMYLPGDDSTVAVLVADATGSVVHAHVSFETSADASLGIAQFLTDRLAGAKPADGDRPTPPPK